MTISVKMMFEGQVTVGRFTFNQPNATAEDVRQFAVQFCQENDTKFLEVL